MISSAPNRLAAPILLAIIIVVGTAVRSYGIADCSLWLDEAASWRAIQFPWNEMFVRVAGDNHVPLYFILLKLWARVFGESLAAMRGLGVVLGGVTSIAVYLFVRAAFDWEGSRDGRAGRNDGRCDDGRWVALAAAALVAVSLAQIKAAGQVRMYTLGTALTAISSWTLFRALHARGPLWRPWAVHTLATLGLAFTHHFGMFSIGGQIVFLAGYLLTEAKWNLPALCRNRTCRGALASYGTVVVCWGLSLPVLYRQVHQVEKQWWTPPLSVNYALVQIRELLIGNSSYPVTEASLPIAGVVFAAVILALALRAGALPRYILCLTLVPILASLAVSLVGKNLFLARYLVFAQTILLVGLAVVLASLPRQWMRHVAVALLVVGGAIIDADYEAFRDLPNRPGVRGAVKAIESRRLAGEEVVAATPAFYLAAIYYLNDRSHCHLLDRRPIPHNWGAALLTEDDFISAAELRALGPGRVWVISQLDGNSMRVPANWSSVQEEIVRDPPGRMGDIRVEQYEIQEHAPGGAGDQGPHFNVRPIENPRHGVVPGTKPHYLFEEE
jgi:hypothetical protein